MAACIHDVGMLCFRGPLLWPLLWLRWVFLSASRAAAVRSQIESGYRDGPQVFSLQADHKQVERGTRPPQQASSLFPRPTPIGRFPHFLLISPPPPGLVEQAFKPNKHPVELTVTVGSNGLGLILTEDKEGIRWGVKGYRVMPDGQPNPAKASLSWMRPGGGRLDVGFASFWR